MEHSTQDPVALQELNRLALTTSINFAVEVKAAFELMAYRIITQEAYCDRLEDLILTYQKRMKEHTDKFDNLIED